MLIAMLLNLLDTPLIVSGDASMYHLGVLFTMQLDNFIHSCHLLGSRVLKITFRMMPSVSPYPIALSHGDKVGNVARSYCQRGGFSVLDPSRTPGCFPHNPLNYLWSTRLLWLAASLAYALILWWKCVIPSHITLHQISARISHQMLLGNATESKELTVHCVRPP